MALSIACLNQFFGGEMYDIVVSRSERILRVLEYILPTYPGSVISVARSVA